MHPLPLYQIVQRMTSSPDHPDSNPSTPASVEAWRQAALASFLGLPPSASPTVNSPGAGGADGINEDSNYVEAKEYWTAKGGAAVDEKRKEAEECLLAWAQIEPAAFFTLLHPPFLSPSTRLLAATLLTSHLQTHPQSSTPILTSSSLSSPNSILFLDSFLSSTLLDTSHTIFHLNITILLVALSGAPGYFVDRVPELFAILARAVCWKRARREGSGVSAGAGPGEDDDGEEAFDLSSLRSPTGGGQGQTFETAPLSRTGSIVSIGHGEDALPAWRILDTSADITTPPPPDTFAYLSYLYYLWPNNLLSFLRTPYPYLQKNATSRERDWKAIFPDKGLSGKISPYLRSLTFNPDVLLNDDPKAELKDARKKWAAQTSDEIATNVSLLRIFPQSTPVHSTTHTPLQSNTPSTHTPASSRSPVQGRSPSLTRLGGNGGNEKSSDLPLKRITAPSTLATRRSGGAAAGIGGGLGMLARGRAVDRSLASLASSDITPRHHLSPLTQTVSLPASPSMVASLLPDPLLSVPPSSASTTTFSSLQDLHFAPEGPIKPFDASQPLIPYNDIPRDVVSSIVPPPYPQLVADRLSLRIAQVTPPASVPTVTPVSITPTASSSSRSHPGLEPDGIGPALAGPSAGEVEARKGVEKLRREVFLLRNELSFEVYLKNRFVLQNQRLHQEQTKSAVTEADLQSLIAAYKSSTHTIRTLSLDLAQVKTKLDTDTANHRATRESHARTKAKDVKEIAELNAKLGPLEAEVKLVREERDKGKHELGLVKSEKFGLECKLRESEPKIARISDFEAQITKLTHLLKLDEEKLRDCEVLVETEAKLEEKILQQGDLLRVGEKERRELQRKVDSLSSDLAIYKAAAALSPPAPSSPPLSPTTEPSSSAIDSTIDTNSSSPSSSAALTPTASSFAINQHHHVHQPQSSSSFADRNPSASSSKATALHISTLESTLSTQRTKISSLESATLELQAELEELRMASLSSPSRRANHGLSFPYDLSSSFSASSSSTASSSSSSNRASLWAATPPSMLNRTHTSGASSSSSSFSHSTYPAQAPPPPPPPHHHHHHPQTRFQYPSGPLLPLSTTTTPSSSSSLVSALMSPTRSSAGAVLYPATASASAGLPPQRIDLTRRASVASTGTTSAGAGSGVGGLGGVGTAGAGAGGGGGLGLGLSRGGRPL